MRAKVSFATKTKRDDNVVLRRITKVSWTTKDDLKIIKMKEKENKSWVDVAKKIPGRTLHACQTRYLSALKKEGKQLGCVARVEWSNDDDLRIVEMREIGNKSWVDIANCLIGRTKGACQLRYSRALNKREKKVKGEAWTNDDDERIIQMKEIEKKSWAEIAVCFDGRKLRACRERYAIMRGTRAYRRHSVKNAAQKEFLFPTGTIEIDEDGSEMVWL
jgi:hypothetical protein